MSTANRLYDRPDLDQQFGALALYVTGSLADAQVELAYEGRLQIHNAMGACSVEVLDGVIPPGGQVYVDNATSEVVVAWPAYTETPSPPDNAGFETGDLTGWSYTTIGGAGTLMVTPNYPHSGSRSAYWAGGKGLGSEGGIECVLLNDKACVAYPGQRITFKASILYNPAGGTPKGSRGQVRLNWYDGAGTLIDTSYGTLIKGRGNNAKWTDSTGSERAPPGTRSARLAVWLTATGAGHSYCDDASWDAPAIVGTKDESAISLWLRVHDAGGRVADWHGILTVADPRKVLLHFDSIDTTGNPYKIVDERGHLWTVPNNSTSHVDGTHPRFGPASFNTIGGRAQCSDLSCIDLLNQTAWTVDMWVFATSIVGDRRIMAVGGGFVGWNSTNGIHLLLQPSGGKINAAINTTVGPVSIVSSVNFTANVQQHLALCYEPGSLRLYLQGVKVGEVNPGTILRPSSPPTMVVGGIPGEGANGWQGWIDEFCVRYKAVYTSDFTPPTAPYV